MKKIVWIILILVVILGGAWYLMRGKKIPVDPTITTYNNSNLGIRFVYPKILSASTTSDIVTLHHEVPFEHHDYCDFKGDATTTMSTLTDFNVTFQTEDKNLVDTIKALSPYIPEENFVNGAVVPSPGFIDPYTAGTLSGYAIFEGAEGCGFTTYYFPVSDDKTLVIKQDLITVFSGAIDSDNQAAAEAVPGVLDKEKAAAIFESIMNTVKAQ